MERWKSLEFLGFPNYMVSNQGNVKSLNYKNTSRERLLKLRKSSTGYLCVLLSNNGISRQFGVHRLVAEAFIPNMNNYSMVNHKDENKTNNCVNNLEWCTAKYNVTYSRGRKIECIELNKMFTTATEAANELNILNTSINNCLNGRSETAGKYHWRYV